ncbi:MAG: alpha-amylase family protein [Clostridia bacterium]|nr:alpha-amylase family protein [Clostridia bacterium]
MNEAFDTRYARAAQEMKRLYLSLYHDEHAYDYFAGMLRRCHEARRPALRALDAQRAEQPDWFKKQDVLGMLMYTQCFGGTLNGVREHLDYLQETDVNYLHLMPLLQSPKDRSDGGYAVADFRTVQPELGTMEDLAQLADDCHDRGMALCLDFVMNHTSEDHEWARRARAGEVEYQQRYFFYDDWSIPHMYEQTVPQVFPTTAPGNFTWCEQAGKVVMTTFYPYQWDLNYANPTVFNDMTENMLFLCNQGVVVIRLDAVPYIWKALHTTCRNLPQVHTLVRLMRLACECVCPGVLLLGEVVMEPSKVVPYFGSVSEPECHMLYNVTTMASTWHTVATQDVRLLRHQLNQVFALPGTYTFLNYLRCHDDIGWGLDYGFLSQFGQGEVPHKRYLNDYLTGSWPGSASRGELYNNDPRLGDARLCGTTASLCGAEADEALAYRRMEMLHAFLLTLSGVPVLYSGDEIGQKNDYTYHDDPVKREDSRYLHRGAFSWSDAQKRNDPESWQGKVYRMIGELTRIRRGNRAFDARANVWTFDTGSDHVLGIGRYFEGQKLLALLNFCDRELEVSLDGQEVYMNLRSGERVSGCVKLPPCGFAWLRSDRETI